VRRSEGVYHAIGGRPNAAPDLARSIAFAREARHGPVSARPSGYRVAVLGLLVLASAAIAGFSAVRVHADPRFASLGAAADVPAARIREVDVMRKSSLAVVGAVMVATGASAGGKGDGVPPGYIEIGNSETQFSGVQGQDGWTYLFDQGPNTQAQLMPHFVSGNALGEVQPIWCTAPSFGNSGSFCGIGRLYSGTNTPGACSSPQGGYRRSIRQWRAPSPISGQVLLSGNAVPCSSQLSGLIELQVNGTSVYSVIFTGSLQQPVEFTLDVASLESVRLIVDPNDGSCHCDSTMLRVQIFAAACPGDVVANGIVDGADLAALLSVWGTDGGIYPRADTNSDGDVNAADLAAVLSGWGACP
jgi:hypothetical protein